MRTVTEWDINWFYGAKPIYGMWTNQNQTTFYTCANIVRGKFIVVSFHIEEDYTFTPESIIEYSYDEFVAIAPSDVVKECIRLYS